MEEMHSLPLELRVGGKHHLLIHPSVRHLPETQSALVKAFEVKKKKKAQFVPSKSSQLRNGDN